MSFEVDFGKIEKKWEGLSFDEAKKKFKKDRDTFFDKMDEYKRTLDKLKMTSMVVIKNIIYFKRQNELIGSADVFSLGIFSKHVIPLENETKSQILFEGNPTVDTIKFSRVVTMCPVAMEMETDADTTSIMYTEDFFTFSAIIMGAEYIQSPCARLHGPLPIYILYNVTFSNKNIDTFLLQHFGYKVPKDLCTFCGKNAEAKKCSGCECVFYCSVSCQKMHWNVHKKYCKKSHPFDENCEHCVYVKNKPSLTLK